MSNSKTTPTTRQDEPPRDVLQMVAQPGKTEHQQMVESYMDPVVTGAIIHRRWLSAGSCDQDTIGLTEAVSVAQETADKAAAGELDEAKRMLMAQACTLNAIFNDMAGRAAAQITPREGGGWSMSRDSLDTLMRVAFKAQSQCRTTLETLGNLVHPRSVAIIKQAPGSQANVSQGAQQVNNGAGAGATAHAEQGQSGANKLLEANPSERLDIGATTAAGRGNPAVETLGAVHGSEVRGGKVRSLPKRTQAR